MLEEVVRAAVYSAGSGECKGPPWPQMSGSGIGGEHFKVLVHISLVILRTSTLNPKPLKLRV